MMKNLLSTALLFAGFNVFSQNFMATYEFANVTTTTGVTDPTPPPTVTGITFGAFSSTGVSANSTGSARFSFDTWPIGATTGNDTYATYTASIDPNKHYSVTITPASGSTVTLTSIIFHSRRSGTGIRNYAVRSSLDGYTNNLPASTPNPNLSVVGTNIFFWNFDATSTTVDQKNNVITLGSSFMNMTSPVSFRWYAWNAEGNAGTFSIDSVSFFGSVSMPSGVKEYSQDINSAIKLYPNPSNDGTVFIDAKGINYSKIEVVNVLGSVIYSETKESILNEKVKLNLNTLPAGTYFVRLSEGSKVYTERFSISK
jgi:hypothetical protein